LVNYETMHLLTILCILVPMSKSNGTGKEQEARSHVQLFVYRVPKKNHDAMIQLNNQCTDIFDKNGMRFEVFQLGNTDTSKGFTNIASTLSANPDEEVWLELLSYRDRNHREEVGANTQNDKSASQLMKQFMDLITPGSSCAVGEFSRLEV
jgi:uncharacterized protein YbaA (DUF1428 family)